MGHYTGIATRIKVKKTAPFELIAHLDSLYFLNKDESIILSLSDPQEKIMVDNFAMTVEQALESLRQMCTLWNPEFDTWNWRCKEDKGDFWLYESRASVKYDNLELFEMLLNGIVEHLVVEQGDILARSIYEQSSQENVVFFQGPLFARGEGFKYDSDEDPRHPYNFQTTTAEEERRKAAVADGFEGRGNIYNLLTRQDDDFCIPWTMAEVKQMQKPESRKRLTGPSY